MLKPGRQYWVDEKEERFYAPLLRKYFLQWLYYKKRFLKRDKTISNVRTPQDEKLADRIIRNTYKTLLSRGQKGCFIYCEDKSLSDYIRSRLALTKNLLSKLQH